MFRKSTPFRGLSSMSLCLPLCLTGRARRGSTKLKEGKFELCKRGNQLMKNKLEEGNWWQGMFQQKPTSIFSQTLAIWCFESRSVAHWMSQLLERSDKHMLCCFSLQTQRHIRGIYSMHMMIHLFCSSYWWYCSDILMFSIKKAQFNYEIVFSPQYSRLHCPNTY